MIDGSLRGRLLVAGPLLHDPNFHRTVVLVLDHGGDEGALGVVLNRPSTTPLGEALPGWEDRAAAPPVVFVGGPVGVGGALALAKGAVGAGPDGTAPVDPVVGDVGMLDLDVDPTMLDRAVQPVRVFTGYAGWGPGQLEDELSRGDWVVIDAEPGDALDPDPEDLWRAVLRRQPGPLSRWANMPPDLRMN